MNAIAPSESQLSRWEAFVESAQGNVVELEELDPILVAATNYYAYLVATVREVSNREGILFRLGQIIGVLDFAYVDSLSYSASLRENRQTWIPKVKCIDTDRALPVLDYTSPEELDAIVLEMYPAEREVARWHREIQIFSSGGKIHLYVGEEVTYLHYDHPLLDTTVEVEEKKRVLKQIIRGMKANSVDC